MVSCSIPAGRTAVCLGYGRVNESFCDRIVSAFQFSDTTAVTRDILIRVIIPRNLDVRVNCNGLDSLRNDVSAAPVYEIHVSSIILPELVTRDSLPSHNVALHFDIAISAGYDTKIKKFDILQFMAILKPYFLLSLSLSFAT